MGSKKKEIEPGNIDCVIGQHTAVAGDFETSGSIQVSGKIDGSLKAEGEVLVAECGHIKGNISALRAAVAGQVEGNVLVKKTIEISKTGKISGDIQAENVIIEQGAVYVGKVVVGKTEANKNAPLPEDANL